MIKSIWKYSKGWFITTVALVALLLTVTLVLTQNAFLFGTVSAVFGGNRNKVISGDPSQYQYYSVDTNNFEQFRSPGITSKEEALKAANLLNEEIAGEGFVLLKNEQNALPLAKGAKVSVFGKNSVNIVYGGSGSSARSTDDTVDLYAALSNAGFEVNPTLRSFYEGGQSGKGRAVSPQMGTDIAGFATGETPLGLYTGEISASYPEYSDAAIVVITRIGGEGYDLPRTMMQDFTNQTALSGAEASAHYLQLDKNERALIASLSNSVFKKVIVVINCSTPMELGFIKDNTLGRIDAAVWIGNPGGTGLSALGRLLSGEINPSGRTVDLYARDFSADPTWQNFGNNFAGNFEQKTAADHEYTVGGAGQGYYFVEYEEGIYLGYRYYETRGYTDGEAWYDDAVVYPFGYGLSYTTFAWDIADISPAGASVLEEKDSISVTVNVTNTGSVAGKDVVQLYYTPCYWAGEIEKPHVVLGTFEKTPLIQPGATEQVTLTMNVSDMASYDYNDANHNGFCGYELDAGVYTVRLGRDSHDAWAGENSEKLSASYVCTPIQYPYDRTNEDAEVINRFDDVSSHIHTYLSRNDWDYTFPKVATAEEREISPDFIASLVWTQNDESQPYYTTETFRHGEETDLKLYDFIKLTEDGIKVDYEDERWNELLDSLTQEEMATLIGQANFKTVSIAHIDLPVTTEGDGPAGFTAFMGDPTIYGTCFYASECVIGATFNKALAHDMGIMVGIESFYGNQRGDGRTYAGWYAPAVNIHRSPFSGRNWEYYSEDGLLSGMMAANVIAGAKTQGVACFVKHFALNDQETARDANGVLTWANEQAIREIYLKPFEYAVKQGGTIAVMSSFNRIGTMWTGGHRGLITDILSGEWGFRGAVITDYNLCEYMPADQMIRAGGDLNLTQDKKPMYSGISDTQVSLMRQATKDVLYTIAQTNAMNGHGQGVVWGTVQPMWVTVLLLVDIIMAVGLAIWGVFAIRKSIAKSKA
ncbi:MAG: glycoside hydrolase family 3 protein [Lachnospiraceae bacterium]|nr:glycoside hydrolase family 3 protein [Lachnospiraceae bacterium]